ncbi:zinc transporter ZIP10-like [Styela clava]
MVTNPLSKLPSILAMCNPTTSSTKAASGLIHWESKRARHVGRNNDHHCIFKVLKCSSQQLCILCFLLYYFAVGPCIAAPDSTRPLETTPQPPPSSGNIQCYGDSCYLKIESNAEALKKMSSVSEHLFDSYATVNNTERSINEKGLEKFFSDLGLFKGEHEGHDHENHEGHDHDDHEGHDHDDYDAFVWDDSVDYTEFNKGVFGNSNNDFAQANETHTRRKRSEDDNELPCISSVKDLMKAYFQPRSSNDLRMTLGDFMTLMPEILLNIKRPECRLEKESDHAEESKESEHKKSKIMIEHTTRNIWLVSFGSVLLISLVSLLGVMLIPLIGHSHILNRIIAFLVALAVGTLAGDALLHLLPHASGAHDHGKGHEGHNHGNEEEDKDHFDSMWKGLVACAGIYVFYVLETVMGFIHKKKHNKKHHHHTHTHNHSCNADSPSSSSPSRNNTKVRDSTVIYSPSESPLLRIHSPNGKISNGDCNTLSPVPVVAVNGISHAHHEQNGTANGHGHKHVIDMDEEPLETGHHHHHSHEVPKTIASLAWMVIVGDGLHNVTDGLAIGAAFTSSIGAGLSTSLAIFFHEIPQELGDFAILLNSGMTVKQALLCNFLSACLCFVGLIIGLIVGEYTSGIILWILAFTAGGFLYIALVDMLPAMMKQLDHKDCYKRFLIQNVGILCGYGLMVVIALQEDAFTNYF